MIVQEKLLTLHPIVRDKAARLHGLCEREGLPVLLFEAFRTEARQNGLYALGRTAPGKIVTEARGADFASFHQWGLALDFIRADGLNGWYNADGFFDKIGPLGEAVGLAWGGRFKKYDGPHFEDRSFGGIGELKARWGTPAAFIAGWV
jgi:peptidoglycan L-alanyl-D-glutamate endopeptidase CwlK